MSSSQQLLRSLPAVGALLEHEEVTHWLEGLPRSSVVAALQSTLDEIRREILAGRLASPVAVADILAHAESELVARSMPSLRRVINATGIVLHTGLGRAPLCDAAIEAIVEGASGYCNLELDLESGARGHRGTHISGLLARLTGAEAGVVVNNNAAATLLILRTLATGREVIVSRGELVEIGGSYRLPDILAASGARLREVGTTNRTRIGDYEKAICDATALLLRVHTSNFRVVGFTESASMAEVAALAHRFGLIAVDDLGSGALLDADAGAAGEEPRVRASIEAGADLVCFSGDKLLGGPQCGVIVGRQSLIERLERDPLMRTYRVGKLTLLALEATLRCYLDPEEAKASLPVQNMLNTGTDELAGRARSLAERLQEAMPGERFLVCSDVGYAGGGSMPGHELPTVVVEWRPAGMSVDAASAALRHAETPVVARIRDGAICFDLRTIRPMDMDALVGSASQILWEEDARGSDGDVRLPVL